MIHAGDLPQLPPIAQYKLLQHTPEIRLARMCVRHSKITESVYVMFTGLSIEPDDAVVIINYIELEEGIQ